MDITLLCLSLMVLRYIVIDPESLCLSTGSRQNDGSSQFLQEGFQDVCCSSYLVRMSSVTDRCRNRCTDMWIGIRVQGQTDIQTDEEADRCCIHRQTDRQIYRKTDARMDGRAAGQAGRRTDRQTERWTDGWAGRQTD